MSEEYRAEIDDMQRLLALAPVDRLQESPLAEALSWAKTGRPSAYAELAKAGLDGGHAMFQFSSPAAMIDWQAFSRRTLSLSVIRDAYIQLCGYSIPCAEAVAALVALGPLVEIGAGTGYWAAILRAAGADIVATDLNAGRHSGYSFQVGVHDEVQRMGAVAAVRAYPDRAVFCSWPSYGMGWGNQALHAMRPGQLLALIGENDGCTGDHAMTKYLDSHFAEIAEVTIPQFYGIHDYLRIVRKTRD